MRKTKNLYCLHLKTDAPNYGGTRKELIETCWREGFLAIGWSDVHEESEYAKHEGEYQFPIEDLDSYLAAVPVVYGKKKKSPNVFSWLEEDDLVWTRDEHNVYYLCRVTARPRPHFIRRLEVGCVVDVEVHKVGTSVPGAIASRFSTANSPTIQRFDPQKEIAAKMIAYSAALFNQLRGEPFYAEVRVSQNLFELLPPFDLEELVIDYIQVKYDYYLSKNSVAEHSTTPKIECELFPRKAGKPAVVQVKGGNGWDDPRSYQEYLEQGKRVFLFFANEDYTGASPEMTCITRAELLEFVKEYQALLPPAVQQWISLCRL